MATQTARDGIDSDAQPEMVARLAKARPRNFAGLIPNEPHQKPDGFVAGAGYSLAIMEFDDQGCAYERAQMAMIKQTLDDLAGQDAIFIVFTHGWKHDGRSDDDNLQSFEALLGRTVQHEQQVHDATGATGTPRPVYGIFVAWRGMTLYAGGWLENVTFWGRQQAAHRVATGEPRELFGRLRHYRRQRRKLGGSPLLVIVGHSFGGLIVYSALEQSLIDAASAPADQTVPGFADMVLLVNPAFGAMRYLPIHTLGTEPDIAQRTSTQLPVFVCATARNDWATGLAFPIGNVRDWFTEDTRGPLQAKCLLRTIGHVDDLITHRLASPQGGTSFVLDPPQVERPNPFWIVQAEPEVINGHNGIFQLPFLAFAASLLFVHVVNTKTQPGSQAASLTLAEPLPGGGSPSLNAIPTGPGSGRTLSEVAVSIQHNDAAGAK